MWPDDDDTLPPSWQFADEDQPPLAPWPVARRRGPDPITIPLVRAQDAIARLEAAVEATTQAVAAGLRARIALHEASGLLGHAHIIVHPRDLALHQAGLTGSYAAASILGTLANELPWSFTDGAQPAPKDWLVDRALQYGQLWQHRAHQPDRWRAALDRLGAAGLTDNQLTTWAERVPNRTEAPALLAAAQVAAEGLGDQGRGDRLDAPSLYMACCIWRLHGFGHIIALPFWSAPQSRIDALARLSGLDFQRAWLDCITESALRARRELAALLAFEHKAATLKAGGRSHLLAATACALREPVLTARGLAEAIGVSTRSALDLLKRLEDEGLLREATGRLAWRAFVINAVA